MPAAPVPPGRGRSKASLSLGPEWHVEVVRGPAGRLHADAAELVSHPGAGAGAGSLRRGIRIVEAEAPAIVLGSSQPESHVDPAKAAAAGLAVVRRRSGGGAVLVGPSEVLWVDVVIPHGDPLWTDDVSRAGWWLADCWVRAVASATGAEPQAWRGEMLATRWSPLVCFAGLGPGEVTVNGAKVVGMSQRRTRHGALFQTAALLRWRPGPLLDLFAPSALPPAARADAEADLTSAAAGLGGGFAGMLRDALVEEIQRVG